MRIEHVAFATLLASMLAGCRSPTQIEVAVTTDVPCGEVTATSFTPGELGVIETDPAATTSTTCNGGYLGTIVMVPSGDDGEEVAFKIVTAFDGTQVDQCTADAGYAGNCIVARRALRYLPHTTLSVPVKMARVCAGNDCGDPTMTCVEGQCVSATIPDPSQCEGSGCGEQTLLPADGGAPEDAGSPTDATVPFDATVHDASGGDSAPPVDAPGTDATEDSASPPPFDAGPIDGQVPGCDLGGLQPGSPWPMNGYCPARRARSPLLGPTTQPMHSWHVGLGAAAGFLWTAPAVAADGTVFVTTGNDRVEAFTPTGTQLWDRALPASGGYVGIAPALAADQTLRTIDFNSASYMVVPLDGGAMTSVTLEGNLAGEGSLTIVSGGTMYFGDQNGDLDAVNALGQRIWSTAATSNESDYVAVNAAGEILTGYSGAGAYLAGLDPDGGALVWTGSVVGGDRLTQVSVAVDQTVRASSYGNVYFFDPAQGPDAGPVWVQGLAQTAGMAVADDGWTYATTGSGPPDGGPAGIYAYSPEGGTVVASQGNLCSSPIIDAAQNVYAFCGGAIVAFSPHLASPLWSVELDTTFPAYAGMILNDTVVLGQGGNVYFTANAPLADGGTTPVVCALTP